MTERELFIAALQQPDEEARGEFLERACADERLRERVGSMLREHAQLGSFLERPASPPDATTDHPHVSEGPGTVIGPYKLLEPIGEGGFGVVFMAEQTAPVRRRVALKILKPGMDTREVVARLEAEQQALAIMDHPNIAKVFDGGATPSGRPYFVMELVRGLLITDYCDRNHLTPRDRLELFVSVCEAVQHAHQKGIIHRDLKPSNILVSVHDVTPVVKVIDFGVAKAMGQELTDKTLFTGFAQMIGTPLYMSPEQAGQSGLDVDTRSDIYSLGVLLYELLTGTTPFDKERLKRATYEEIRRIIRDEEPPRPSTRLSTTEALASVASDRGLETRKLSGQVRGELDWIVMKCLEKDRDRRYQTANGLAMDIRRYLRDEPVQACSPSASYRFRKFARRNKGKLLAASLVAAALIAGTITSTWLAVRAVRAEKLAEERLDAEKHARSDADAARRRAVANLRSAHEAVDRMLTRVAEKDLAQVPQMDHVARKLLEDALEFNKKFFLSDDGDPQTWLELGRAHIRHGEINRTLGRSAAAEQSFRDGTDLLERLTRMFPANPEYRRELVRAYQAPAQPASIRRLSEEKERTLRRANALIDELVVEDPGNPENRRLQAQGYRRLSQALIELDRPGEAELIARRAAGFAVAIEDWDTAAFTHNQLAGFAMRADRLNEAETHLRAATQAFDRAARGTPDKRFYLEHLGNARQKLASLLARSGRAGEAEGEFREALRLFERLVREHPDTVYYSDRVALIASHYGDLLASGGRRDEATIAYRTGLTAHLRIVSRLPLEPPRHERLRRLAAKLDQLLVQASRQIEREQLVREIAGVYESLLQEYSGHAVLEQEWERLRLTLNESDTPR